MNPSDDLRSIKPMHNGKNSKTAAAPAPNKSAKDAPRNKITGTQVPKTDATNLPLNRAKYLFAAAAKRRATASGEGMGSC